jgi:hypothetical protein
MSPFIETASGKRFAPLTPAVADICPGDIAHALSNQCRFSGHVRTFYSVAEHSVRVSELLEAWGCGRVIQLWGLLHDASEAYLVDLPSPLKNDPAFGAYRDAERTLMEAVCERFDLPVDEPAAVRRADLVLLATEARDLMPFTPEYWSKLTEEPLATKVVPWDSVTAERNFLRRFLKVAA